MKLLFWFIFFVLCLVVVVWIQWPSSQVRATVCDVGQGDGLVLTEGYSQMVVDVGPENGQVSGCLSKAMPFWDRNLEVIIVTHADSDHVGGLSHLLNDYTVDTIVTTQVAEEKVKEIVAGRSSIVLLWQGQQLQFGTIRGDVIWPPFVRQLPDYGGAQPTISDDTNRQSLVLRLNLNNSISLWLAGDADVFVENRLINNSLVSQTDILKVGHHGSRTSSSEPFLAILKPSQVWVSVGKNNRYGHPALDVVERLERVGATILRTDILGTFKVEF